jgi:Zn ribbon nucleic-acid-binding protein
MINITIGSEVRAKMTRSVDMINMWSECRVEVVESLRY